jgi:uncharacterized membrane protein
VVDSSLVWGALTFRSWFPWWLSVVLGIISVVAVILLYLRESGRLPAWRRALLASLRALAILGILFLLLRPTWLRESKQERGRPIALLVDDSQSMLTKDPRVNLADQWRLAIALDKVPADKTSPSEAELPSDLPEKLSRLDVARSTLQNPRLELLKKLAEQGPLQPASFGSSRIARDSKNTEWLNTLKGQETRTALYDTIQDYLKRDDNERPSAIVLVTDGRENSSKSSFQELVRDCLRADIPLHIYGVGSSSFGTVQLRETTVPETLFVEDTVSVGVRYRVKGFKDAKVEIITKLNGQEVARKVVDAKEGDDLREVLSFVPNPKDAQAGKQELSTSVRVMTRSETQADELSKSVRVVDRKVKILVVDSIPRWDFKFLQRALLRDRRVDPQFILTEGDRRAMEAGAPFLSRFPINRQELLAYDLLILGDVPSSYFGSEGMSMIRDFVAEGGGLIHIAGRNHAPASFVGTPLADLLPVDLQPEQFAIDSGARPQGFRPDLTLAGIRSPLLSLNDDPVESLRIWRTLPELFWAYPVLRSKPATEVLLTHPTQRTQDNKPMPVLASHYYGKGYVLYSGFDETWRWRFNEADRFFGRYWSQSIYVAGVPRTVGTKLTQLSLDTTDPLLGKTGQVYARLFNSELKPLTAEKLEARLERLDVGPEDKDRVVPVELKAMPGQPGDYVATLPFNRLGRFILKVDTGNDPGSLEYRVTLPQDHELAPGGMAEADLKYLAEQTGGKFYREEDLQTMPQSLPKRTVPVNQRDEILLWNVWSLLAIIGLLSLEWLLRKMNSLS